MKTTTRRRKKKSTTSSSLDFHKQAQKRETELNMRSAAIGNILETLNQQLAQLNEEIKADEEGIHDYEADINKLNAKKAELQKVIDENKEFCDHFDAKLGPFEERYSVLKTSIGSLYNTAKQRHSDAIELLIKHFDYHPAYKRWNDEFTGVAFRPK